MLDILYQRNTLIRGPTLPFCLDFSQNVSLKPSKALQDNLDFQIQNFHQQSPYFQWAALAFGSPYRGPPKAVQSNIRIALICCVKIIKPNVDEDEEQASELNLSKVPL